MAALAFGRLRIARYKSPGVRWPYAVRSDGDIPFTNSTAFHQLHGNTVQVLLQRGQVGFSSRASNQAMSDDDAISHPQGKMRAAQGTSSHLSASHATSRSTIPTSRKCNGGAEWSTREDSRKLALQWRHFIRISDLPPRTVPAFKLGLAYHFS